MQEVPLSPEIQGGKRRPHAVGTEAALVLPWDALSSSIWMIPTFGQLRSPV